MALVGLPALGDKPTCKTEVSGSHAGCPRFIGRWHGGREAVVTTGFVLVSNRGLLDPCRPLEAS